jgi:hypothetical protein
MSVEPVKPGIDSSLRFRVTLHVSHVYQQLSYEEDVVTFEPSIPQIPLVHPLSQVIQIAKTMSCLNWMTQRDSEVLTRRRRGAS